MTGAHARTENVYYCRGCGGLLSDGKSAHFHPECLKTDKRRRVAERRQGEARRFQSWLRRQQCPDCGANLKSVACQLNRFDATPSDTNLLLKGGVYEASQTPADRLQASVASTH